MRQLVVVVTTIYYYALIFFAGAVAALVVVVPPKGVGRQRRRVVDMCICVDCKLVDRCTAYHVIEAKHGQPHLSQAPDFTPRAKNPTVAIIVSNKTGTTEAELDVTACADFVEEKGRWRRMMPPGTLVKAGFDADFVPT
ncbi:hypothetical protein CTAYLR_005013 [Chrysophaeum taylorii]|uniref:Uncharacterized protein n=1 Tax=Chrysophaeum taylorii TaxID=2483200 RepID=A0AAD7XMH0_9STRA|nr:hypothetical protein CTAYLR_005013 [Chrysophaeum taylorii]